MRNLKKFLALVLAMLMAMSLMVTASAANARTDYPDMENVLDEFEEAVDVLSGMGVFRGNNGKFLPQDKIMRCEAVAILYRLVTGDVDDIQVKLYAPLATYFSDVNADDWFAPYVGFAVDAGYIKGYNGKFNPYDNVTGYEMLAMLLRAVGYGKNGEFTGAQWQINVGSQAQALGVLKDIESTHYAHTLSRPSPREVVADLTFRVAVDVPTVRYEMGYYNPWDGVAVASQTNRPNPTLGQREFGLASQYGHIVGNQATGEAATRLDFGSWTSTTATQNAKDQYGNDIKLDASGNLVFKYGDDGKVNATWEGLTDVLTVPAGTTYNFGDNYVWGAANTRYAFGTGLDMFAHAATAWYDSRTGSPYKTYAIIDNAAKENEYIYSEGTTIGGVTGATSGNEYWSDRYSQIGTLAYTDSTNLSPIRTYSIVHNPDADVYIALSAEVGIIEEKNSTAAVPYLTLGSTVGTVVSTFTNSSTQTDRIYLSRLTPDTKAEQKETGALVTAYQIVGTSFNLTTAPTISGADLAKIMYQLDPMKTKTVTVATYFAPNASTTPTTVTINNATPVITSVTPVGEDAMGLSGIVNNGGNGKIISRALPIAVNANDAAVAALNSATNQNGLATNLKAGVTYTAYTDLVGRFISLVPVAQTRFLYGTYAGYDLDGYNAGTIKYNMVGVGWDAKEEHENTLKSITISNVDTPIAGAPYNTLPVTKKDQGQVVPVTGGSPATPGNEIQTGINTGYMYNPSTGNLDPADLNGTLMANTTWNFTSTDASYGFKKVTNGAAGSTQYLVTNDTQFIIVTGTGTATLKVETAKGITGLLAGGTSADITKTAAGTPITGDMNNVYFQTDEDLFGTTHTNDNAVILKVILSDGNLTRWNAQTLYFNYTAAAPTGVKLPGVASTRNVEQFALWNNGELGYYFIDLGASLQTDGTSAWSAAGTTVEAQTFYTLAKIDDVNGIPVYRAVALVSPSNVDYTTGYNSLLSGGSPVLYNYITVNNLSTAQLSKTGGTPADLVYSIADNVTVCDVQYKTVAGTAAVRKEITNIRELNNAVSVMLSNGSTAAYNGVQVAVVYDGTQITCIYVTTVPTIGAA